MSKAAPRIYVYPEFTHSVTRRGSTDVGYVREDIVDELVEALKGVVRYAGNNGDDYLADKARWALTKLEENHDRT